MGDSPINRVILTVTFLPSLLKLLLCITTVNGKASSIPWPVEKRRLFPLYITDIFLLEAEIAFTLQWC